MRSTVTLTKVRVAKNGLVSYKENRKRSTGVIYMDSKMFEGGSAGAPDTIVLSGNGFADVAAEPEKPAKTEAPADAAPAAEAPAEI